MTRPLPISDRWRGRVGWLLMAAWTIGGAVSSHGYSAEEVEAILMSRPAASPSNGASFTLARQKQILIHPTGGIQSRQHVLQVIGSADIADHGEYRWTFRPEVEAVRFLGGQVHRVSGEARAIPSSAVQIGPCAAAGPQGYPGIADLSVRVTDLEPGDVVEIVVEASKIYYLGVEQCFGEHCFASADSTVESELSIRVPPALDFRPRPLGPLAQARIGVQDGLLEGRWLAGFLPPWKKTTHTLLAECADAVPDTVRDLGLWFGFDTSWDRLVVTRRGLWRRALSEVPEELSEARSRLLALVGQGADPIETAMSWLDQRLVPVELAAARFWFEPAPLSAVLARGGALPRDRALALVWLLREAGIRADAASLASTKRLLNDPAMPQRLDAWAVRVRPAKGEERWVDLRPEAARGVPLPAGEALVWTADPGDPAVVAFPGFGP